MKSIFRGRELLLILTILFFWGCEPDAPVASFSPSSDHALVGETVVFTNTSKNAASYNWNFGDGNISTEESPLHAYSEAGTFVVELTATGEGGLSSATAIIAVEYPEPKAEFVMDKMTAVTGEPVTFTNLSQDATSYLWDFGDGMGSTAENPVYSYSYPGIFTITLTASGEGGTNSISKTLTVEEAQFNIVPGDRIGNFTLGFTLETHFIYIHEESFGYGYIDLGDGYYAHILEFDTTGIGLLLITNSLQLYYSDVPEGIYAFDPFVGWTEKEITFGSTLAEVEAAYGTPDEITAGGSYSYTATLGISFWADSTQTFVEEIYIEAPAGVKSSRSVPQLPVLPGTEFPVRSLRRRDLTP